MPMICEGKGLKALPQWKTHLIMLSPQKKSIWKNYTPNFYKSVSPHI